MIFTIVIIGVISKLADPGFAPLQKSADALMPWLTARKNIAFAVRSL